MPDSTAKRFSLRSLAEALEAAFVMGMVVTVVIVVVGVTRPGIVLAPEATLPLLLIPAYPIAILNVVRRRWWVVAPSVAIVAAHLALCVPVATADAQPRWASHAPTFRIYSANVRFDNDRNREMVQSVMAAHADVVVLNEVMPDQLALLRRAGAFARYRVEVHSKPADTFGELLMTRLPTHDARLMRAGGVEVPSVVVRVHGVDVRVIVAHPESPSLVGVGVDRWERDIGALRAAAASAARHGPVVVVGDFNASSWHAPFRRILDAGFRDAHDVLGEGLSMSWAPLELRLPPIMRLDHCLYSDSVSARSVRNGLTPGSDHRPFTVTLAVRRR